jgi:aromatic-L-amino-acid decarboxylase
MQIRWFGTEGIAERLREHVRLARQLAAWIEADPEWELLAPVPLSTVCFRHVPPRLAGREEDLDRHNEALLAEVNRDGRVFLSHTKLGGRYTLRVALGNPRQELRHVETCWELLRKAGRL